ncbi:MAG: rhomboid family intramembrane serine protease [Fidelibacterota bacterium]
MFFPYRDDNPHILTPFVTYGIIGINALVFFFQVGLNDLQDLAFTLSYGLIPATVTGIPGEEIVYAFAQPFGYTAVNQLMDIARPHSPFLTIFTSMFIHGGLAHIIGNMWFLWIFGDNVESALGHVRYSIFYIVCGLAAGLSQIVIDVHSIVPMIGASGAVSGVLAAYLLRYPHARIHVFIFLFIFITTIQVPAFVVIGIWFLEQLTNGLGSLGLNTNGGVAWFAHIGGFLAGIAFIRLSQNIRIIRM